MLNARQMRLITISLPTPEYNRNGLTRAELSPVIFSQANDILAAYMASGT